MDSPFKIIGVMIVLALVVGYSINLLSSFSHYYSIKSFTSSLENTYTTMQSLKELSSGGWRQVRLIIPTGYSVCFNNESNLIEVFGAENLSVKTNSDLIYELNLTSGTYLLQLHYGLVSFPPKDETVVFQ